MHAQPILLAGISIRMLATMAHRAGYQALALDYFGDTDLQATCPSRSLLRDYGGRYSPAALVDAAEAIAAPAVAYGASLENHPAEVERLARGRTLLGNTPATLRLARDPLLLATTLRGQGFRFPPTLLASAGTTPQAGGPWLWKPLRSGGGHGIRHWRGGPLPAEGVLQQHVAGLVCSAPFVANGREALLLGLTEQLVGRRSFGANSFRYCGNLLPARIPQHDMQRLLHELQQITNCLTAAFGLSGLGGVDFVWDGQHPWVIEVNPRPTAAMELLDRAYGLRLFDAHVRAFQGQLPAFSPGEALAAGRAAGKAIVYARRDITVGATAGWAALGRHDIPHSGDAIGKGQPVCTIVVEDATADACLRGLRRHTAMLEKELYG